VRPGRLALVLSATAFVVVLVWSALVLPDRVPSHLDAAGLADDWTSRTTILAFSAAMGLLVLVGTAVWTVRLLRAYRPPATP